MIICQATAHVHLYRFIAPSGTLACLVQEDSASSFLRCSPLPAGCIRLQSAPVTLLVWVACRCSLAHRLRWMCHLWEPMRCWYQPLGFYLFMELAGLLGSVALRAAGFKESWWCGLAYYTKNMPQHGGAAAAAGAHQHESMHAQRRQQYKLHGEAAGAAGQAGGAGNAGSTGAGSTEDVPLVLLHGIGMGLIPYIGMLFNMAATGECGRDACHRHSCANRCTTRPSHNSCSPVLQWLACSVAAAVLFLKKQAESQ